MIKFRANIQLRNIAYGSIASDPTQAKDQFGPICPQYTMQIRGSIRTPVSLDIDVRQAKNDNKIERKISPKRGVPLT